MMLNIIRPQRRPDRADAAPPPEHSPATSAADTRATGSQRKGASVRGWSAGLNQLGAGPYRLVGTTTLDEALRLAAASIRQTNRPVGLLVWRGRHAWVMSGFEATADPLRTSDYTVTAAIVMDPLYPYGSAVWGPSPKPREALTPTALGRQFVPAPGQRKLAGQPASTRRRSDDGGAVRQVRARAAVRDHPDARDSSTSRADAG